MTILNGKIVKCYCATLHHHDDSIKSEHMIHYSVILLKEEGKKNGDPISAHFELCANDYRCLKLALFISVISCIHTNCTVNCIL